MGYQKAPWDQEVDTDASPHRRWSQSSRSLAEWGYSLLIRCWVCCVTSMVLILGTPLLHAAEVRVPEGTLVRLKLHDDLTTENAVKGSRVEFDVVEDVAVDARVVVPKGAVGRGVVVDVKGAGKKGARDASVIFRFVSVRAADNQEIPLRVMPTKSRKADSSENEIEINAPIPGSREGMIGAEKGEDFAAYTDTDALVTAPEPKATSGGGQAGGTVPPSGSEGQAAAPELVLPPEEAYVDFRSNPPGAELLIDGTSRGTTPLRLQVPPGRHEIQIRLAGYRTWTRNMVVDPGSKPSVRASLEKE